MKGGRKKGRETWMRGRETLMWGKTQIGCPPHTPQLGSRHMPRRGIEPADPSHCGMAQNQLSHTSQGLFFFFYFIFSVYTITDAPIFSLKCERNFWIPSRRILLPFLDPSKSRETATYINVSPFILASSFFHWHNLFLSHTHFHPQEQNVHLMLFKIGLIFQC